MPVESTWRKVVEGVRLVRWQRHGVGKQVEKWCVLRDAIASNQRMERVVLLVLEREVKCFLNGREAKVKLMVLVAAQVFWARFRAFGAECILEK